MSRRTVRFGLLATAGLAALASAAPAAEAAEGIGHDVGVATDDVFSRADAAHTVDATDSFTVHQFGPLVAAHLHNEAVAASVACHPDRPCRSVALSFQIDTMAGTRIHLQADNTSSAENIHCAGCETFAGAWQFVVSTPQAFRLTPAEQARLGTIHRQLDALTHSKLPTSEVRAQADVLAGEVTTLLQTAAAHAPQGPGTDPLGSFRPTVTVQHHFAG
ncbi:hypothetical protein [Phaeacidiphilus oryzae]|uniref:hypothetical protein n=1 Tax=Phaeacidiphilus oryzae TaxID=348818 RepID=UPI00126A3261|nr:hypothetical protein [Phaeacidiphilus oryzae]